MDIIQIFLLIETFTIKNWTEIFHITDRHTNSESEVSKDLQFIILIWEDENPADFTAKGSTFFSIILIPWVLVQLKSSYNFHEHLMLLNE